MRTQKLPRVDLFGPCITRAWTIRAVEAGALNLSQGFPEDEPPTDVIVAACEAIRLGPNQYADMRGAPALRRAVAAYYRTRGLDWVDADEHVSITCGSTEAMAASVLAVAGPGDEVVIAQPCYENYPPQALIAGARVRYMNLVPPKWEITRELLDGTFGPDTKVLILNTPNNPTGRVFTRNELQLVAEYACRFDVQVLVDEIYEHLVWDEREHVRLATLPGMAERTVTVSGISKTYSATGWRVGWAVAPNDMTLALRRVHDFLTATVPTPFQTAAVVALGEPPDYYRALVCSYEARRQLLANFLAEAGLDFETPEGAYYFFPSCEPLGFPDANAFAEALLEKGKVAVVPYSAFYREAAVGGGKYRFRINFAKNETTLRQAGERLVAFARSRG